VESTENLTFERDGSTAIVIMNRPEAKNALSVPMLVGMVDAWEEIDNNDDIRCAILTGAGGTFCSGMDLKSVGAPMDEKYSSRMAADPDLHWKALLRHYNVKKPLIAAVEGYAVPVAPRSSRPPTSGWPGPAPSSACSRLGGACFRWVARRCGYADRFPTPSPWSCS